MSLKDLFQVKKVLAPISNEQIAEELESPQLLESQTIQQNRIEFAVNYATASNFAIFGSAKKYYQDSIQRIYQQYPYDGSKKEKIDWYNSSSLLDIWFYENAYPRTTGYGTFSPSGWSTQLSSISGYGNPTTKEYIVIKSGPNNKPSTTSLKDAFTDLSNQNQKANIYNVADNRTSNLKFNLSGSGVTLEFWLKKNSFITSSTAKEVIFDLWNGVASSSAGYGRLTLELSGNTVSPFYLTAQSGTAGFFQQNIGTSVTTSSVASNLWNHYAVSLANSASSINVNFYVNGDLNSSYALGTAISDVTGGLVANLGALRTAPSGVSGVGLGWGKLSGSIDEFRYWKTEKTDREIGRNWWTYVGGGTNTDDANTDLGVYYKFNEGITTTSSVDSIVLDYSGRVSNGTWVGYSSVSRNTGSAINEFTTKQLSSEEPDPIIYSQHPSITDVTTTYESIGVDHDVKNPNTLYYSFPNWIVDEDEDGELLNITQIAASYLDTLYLQIKYFTSLKDHYTNIQIDEKPYPFSQMLLESTGLVAPNLFVDARLVEEVLSRNDEIEYEDKLNEIKNIIYQNIYSNITNIFKSKGTEKSFRNLIRCFGIDEEIVKFHVYSNNDFNTVKDNYKNITAKKKSVSFNDPDRFNSSIYQRSIASNTNSISYVTGSSAYAYLPLSAEIEVVFSKKLTQADVGYFPTPFLTSSIFGAHGAVSNSSNFTWASPQYFDFQVSAVRTELESNDVYFVASSSYFGVQLTSSIYFNTYNNEKWNFAVKITPNDVDSTLVSGTLDTLYTLHFYGVNAVGNTVKNQFVLTSSLTNTQGINALSQNKRFYIGSERVNFTGSLVKQSDIKALGFKVWSSDLSYDDLTNHASDPYSYGIADALENSTLTKFNNVSIPKIKTLLVDWNFNLITGSDNGSGIPAVSDAGFDIQDLTSGSVGSSVYNQAFNTLSNYQYTARGDFFLPNKTDVVDTQYVFSSRLTQFEDLRNSDLINILDSEEIEVLTKQTRPINYFFSFEKSMYQTISEEMLKMFSTILDFNNLVGEPVNKYRKEHKSLSKLRQLFFDKVQNEPDLDKYLDFYKWIDSALGKFLFQLVPASANSSEGLLNVIESHAFERNKVQYKFPTIEFKLPVIEAGAQSINKHLYDWKTGHRPLSNNENNNCLYWNQRAERDVSPISSSNAAANNSRKAILSTSVQALNRRFTTTYRFDVEQSKQIKGGVNFEANKNIDFSSIALAPHGPLDTDDIINVPANYLVSLIERTSSLIQNCNDVTDPNKKIKYYFNTVHGRDYLSSSLGYGEILSSKIALPINVISGTDNSGYQAQVSSEFMNGAIITNIHNDTYGYMNEVPVQGPFTNAWVGGRQSRHVNLNTGGDTYLNRAEAWKILLGTGSFSGSYQTVLGMVGADYPFPEGNPDSPSYPVRAHLRATYLREETAKRPVNIRNIQTTTGSAVLGNYSNTYEIVHSFGSTTNNRNILEVTNPNNITELEGVVRTNTTTGKVDFELQPRTANKSIVITRFSSPGERRTMSVGYMNKYAEEISPYNALPFKNREIIGTGRGNRDVRGGISDSKYIPEIVSGSRRDLNSLVAYYTDFGGTVSGSNGLVASLHKTNRNPILKATLTSSYDNGFVSHTIPRKETGYSWIVAANGSGTFGTINNNYTIPTGSTLSYYENSLFITASSQNSYDDSGYRLLGDYFLGTPTKPIPVDFVGLNTIVFDSCSYNTLGSTQLSQVTGTLITSISTYDHPFYFNALMSNRNGATGFSTIKQTRVGQHKLVRKLNKTNYLLIQNGNQEVYEKEPVVYFNAPFTTNVKNETNGQVVKFTYPYQNLLQAFENDNLDKNLEFTNYNETFYEKVVTLLSNNSKYKLVNLKVSNSIYPRKSLKSLLEGRKRNNYIFSAWRDSRTDRNINNQTSIFNITGTLISKQSIWPMDNALNSSSSLSSSTGGEGVLQNAYSSVHFGTQTRITASVLYAHKHMNTSIESYKNKQAISAILPFSQSNTQIIVTNGLFDGTTKWQTADNTNGPYEDSYDKWFEKIRSIEKDYSIIPEFIISDDQKILAVQRNELDNAYLNSLSLTGSTITDTTGSQFFDSFVKSDSITNISKIKQDLNSATDKIKLTLSCDAIIKLNPKPELYPQYQTVKLADKFANSIKDYSKFWVDSQNTASTNQRDFRTLLTPMFAPGILFNTIKSGIAVDYPILTSSLTTTGSFYLTRSVNTELSYQIKNNFFHKRLPFETLIEPENYLTTDIIDMEPHPSASLNVTGSWTGQYSNNLYKFAMNNFLAESINFFLPDGKLTTVFSKPETEFKEVDPNLEYRAVVKIYKTADNVEFYEDFYGVSRADRLSYVKPEYPSSSVETITMYSRPTGFGPPCSAGGVVTSSFEGVGTLYSTDTNAGYNPGFTPPYYDGSSWALLTFKPSGSNKYKPTLQEIINNITSSYVRFELPSRFGTNTDGPYFASRINQNSMQVTASLNLFNIVNTQDVSLTNTDSSLTEAASKVWGIQTKFETPILNFDPSQTGVTIQSGSKVPTVGMWHQFGQLPDDDKGIYLQVMDVPESYILKGLNGVYTNPISPPSENSVPQLTASLSDIVGFNKTPVKLGQVANTKQVKEAVVAIPYTIDRNNNINYIDLNENAVNYVRNQFFGKNLQTQTAQAIANASVPDTVKSQIDKMKNYVIPPKYDFINNENINPIAMYIFEFTYNLTQDDLIKIWQGVQPNISVEFDKQNYTIEHELDSNELIDKTKLSDNLKWMVFKVKQKAKNNYYERVLTSIQEKEKKRINNLLKLGRKNAEDSIIKDINLSYSYNWPYDYFSLVELAKIEAEVTFINKEGDNTPQITNVTQETLQQAVQQPKRNLGSSIVTYEKQNNLLQDLVFNKRIVPATTSSEALKTKRINR